MGLYIQYSISIGTHHRPFAWTSDPGVMNFISYVGHHNHAFTNVVFLIYITSIGVEKKIFQDLIHFQYCIWPHWLYPRSWTPDPGVMNIKILVEGFKDIITRHLVFSHMWFRGSKLKMTITNCQSSQKSIKQNRNLKQSNTDLKKDTSGIRCLKRVRPVAPDVCY